jgi:hypothetical protein
MKRCLALSFLILSAMPCMADDERYEVVAVPDGARLAPGGAAHPKVFILDTRDGHMWTWGENDFLPGGDRRLGSALIYQGKLRPGKQAGDIVESVVK